MKCKHCPRATDERCTQCRFPLCCVCAWTQITKVKLLINGVVGLFNEYTGATTFTPPDRFHRMELCRECRDEALKVAA